MSEIITLPDARLSRAVDDICQVLYGITPAIHAATAIGLLEIVKHKILISGEEQSK